MLNYGEVYFIDSGNLFCKVIFYVILFFWIEEKKDMKDFKYLIYVCLKKGLILVLEYGYRLVVLLLLG